jgi:hypothetical protein
VELVLVDGGAGKHLARHQAAVMREVLAWLREYHPTDQSEDRPLT